MNKDKAIIIFYAPKRRVRADLEIPLDITANDFIRGLDEAYHLGLSLKEVKNYYLKSENPIALLKGNRLLSEYGIHNGTIIRYNE